MDNAILELCDSCDYFASPLLVGKKQINLTGPFKKELAVVNSVIIESFVSFMPNIIHILSRRKFQIRPLRHHTVHKWCNVEGKWCHGNS